MQIGKIPNKLLDELVLSKMTRNNGRARLSAGVGLDFCALDFGDECCIVSGDPITGATKNAGATAVHIACNDIATSGAAPVAILTTLLLPPRTTEGELGAIADEIAETAALLGVSVVGGHTEVTDAVNRVVISVTAMGAVKRGEYVTTGGARAGDALIMTKSAGIEGAAIIAVEFKQEIERRFGAGFAERAARLQCDISVVKEGLLAGASGARAMHDVTEGGVFGAAWEMAEASGLGVVVYKDAIVVLDAVREICAFFDIDAYRLISSGSMLIATDSPAEMISILGESGISSANIGAFTGFPDERYIDDCGARERLGQPGPDELYKALRTPPHI